MRLDDYLFKFGFFDSKTKANQSIKRGEVYLNERQILKPSFSIDENITHNISIKSISQFVSLGGYKLEKALNDFNLSVENLICADIGASTGGFTDCLLQQGAKKVYAVDLNEDLLHISLKNNPQVFTLIKNARNLKKDDFLDKIDLLVADLSFISATLVMEVFSKILDVGKRVVLLIKPQFELDIKKKFKNGIIRDTHERKNACRKIYDCAINNNFAVIDFTTAPFNKEKNLEYLILLEKSDSKSIDFDILFNKCNIF
jgi:23S rRNA (cytidine1920-2'-O)/16S rRNA (cytidine1409-2'-O)-methyltransferase